MEIHDNKALALERMILFSDAVFGIAITLLVIELHLPDLSEYSEHGLRQALLHVLPHFISFLLSFFIIGIYWVAHHRMFRYVVDFDQRLLWLNLLLLLGVVLMPFSSNVLGVYGSLHTSFYLYVSNITLVALLNFLLYAYIADPKKKLSKGLEDRRLVSYYKARACVVPLCFLVGVILTFVFDNRGWQLFSRFSPILIWPALVIIRKRYRDVLRQDTVNMKG